MMRLACLCMILLGGALSGHVNAENEDVSVLFVGHDPANPDVPFRSMATDRTYELYGERTQAFQLFLEERFERVKVVYAQDYDVAMSDDFDVTIFDAQPKPLVQAKEELDPETNQPVYRAPMFLPEDFDRPALMIAENSARIGEGIGLKLDWL